MAKMQDTSAATPLAAMIELNRWQMALATESACAMWRASQVAAQYWQEMTTTGITLQGDLIRSCGYVPDPAAVLASANLLD